MPFCVCDHPWFPSCPSKLLQSINVTRRKYDNRRLLPLQPNARDPLLWPIVARGPRGRMHGGNFISKSVVPFVKTQARRLRNDSSYDASWGYFIFPLLIRKIHPLLPSGPRPPPNAPTIEIRHIYQSYPHRPGRPPHSDEWLVGCTNFPEEQHIYFAFRIPLSFRISET